MKNYNKHIIFLFALITILFVAGCGSVSTIEDDINKMMENQPHSSGRDTAIKGTVNLIGTSNYSGVCVRATSAYGYIYSENDGSYYVNRLTPGNQLFTFSKEGWYTATQNYLMESEKIKEVEPITLDKIDIIFSKETIGLYKNKISWTWNNPPKQISKYKISDSKYLSLEQTENNLFLEGFSFTSANIKINLIYTDSTKSNACLPFSIKPDFELMPIGEDAIPIQELGIDSSNNLIKFKTPSSNQKYIFEYVNRQNELQKTIILHNDNAELNYPKYMKIGKNDEIYLLNYRSFDKKYVVHIDQAGNIATKYGSVGTANYNLNDPQNYTVDDQGNVYIIDSVHGECKLVIKKFWANGNFDKSWDVVTDRYGYSFVFINDANQLVIVIEDKFIITDLKGQLLKDSDINTEKVYDIVPHNNYFITTNGIYNSNFELITKERSPFGWDSRSFIMDNNNNLFIYERSAGQLYKADLTPIFTN